MRSIPGLRLSCPEVRRVLRSTLDFVLFQAAWFACVWGGAIDDSRPGLAAVGLFLIVHLLVVTPKASRCTELVSITLFASLGVALEAIGVTWGTLCFHESAPRLLGLPIWMWCLWWLFPPLLDSTLEWMRGRAWIGVAFGAVGGPLAYLAGESLGALRLGSDRMWALLGIGVIWAVYTPTVVAARAWFTTIDPPRRA